MHKKRVHTCILVIWKARHEKTLYENLYNKVVMLDKGLLSTHLKLTFYRIYIDEKKCRTIKWYFQADVSENVAHYLVLPVLVWANSTVGQKWPDTWAIGTCPICGPHYYKSILW